MDNSNGYDEVDEDIEFENFIADCMADMARRNKFVIESFCKEIGFRQPVGYHNEFCKGKLTLYTTRPGVLIGYHGKGVDLLKEYLRKEFNRDYKIEFVEIRGGIVNLNNGKEDE